MTDLRRRLRDDRGQAGGWEIVPFGLLVFVVGTLLLANAWAVLDAKLAVVEAAREGARTFVRADDETAARAEAHRREVDVMRARHRGTDRVVYVDPTVTPAFERCGRVTVTVRDTVPALVLPFLARWGRGFTVEASQRELIDPYRSGLPEVSDCAS